MYPIIGFIRPYGIQKCLQNNKG